MSVKFLLRLLGWDLNRPLAVFWKLLQAVGDTPLRLALTELFSRMSEQERLLLVADLKLASQNLDAKNWLGAAQQVVEVLFSLKP